MEEFEDLLKRNFREVDIYLQKGIIIEKPIPDKKYYLAVAVCKQ